MKGPTLEVRVLDATDESIFERVKAGVFDNKLNPSLTAEFLHDPRHHIAVALEDAIVIGIASAVHYIHPDKPAELWINEVSVAEAYQNRGIGKQLMRALFDLGKSIGCKQAWVLAEKRNKGAIRFYKALSGKASSAVMFEFELSQ